MDNQEDVLKGMRSRISGKNISDSYQAACEASEKPLHLRQEEIRVGLKRHVTDTTSNAVDTMGDGDHSPIKLPEPQKEFYRNLYSSGGDIYATFESGTGGRPLLTDFGLSCSIGASDVVMKALQLNDQPGKLSTKLLEMLETRETSMRLSPLLMIVAIGKNISGINPKGLLTNAKALIRHGCRVDAKDVVGKTVCHYGAGVVATKTTMQIVEWCVQAYQSSQFLNQEVELHSLKNAAMNGKIGIARGFNVDNGRRVVYLTGEDTPVGIKPENLKLRNNKSPKALPNLCDVQDRLGGVSLLEVFMSDRTDVAEFLLDTVGASIDVADWDGYSPSSMASTPGAQMGSAVGPVIMKHAMKQARKATKAALKSCVQCGATEKTPSKCSKCKSVAYCSRECQTIHWKAGHKQVCKQVVEENNSFIILEKPEEQFRYTACTSFRTGKTEANGNYQKPRSAKFEELFYVKIQGGSDTTALLIYDKSRECQFSCSPGQRGFSEMLAKGRADPSAQGRKTYMAASFDSKGNCKVYPGNTTNRPW